MVDIDQTWKLSDRGTVVCGLVRANPVWDIIFTQEPGQEGFFGLYIPVPLKQDIEHEAVLIHRLPQPVSDAVDARTHLILSANSGRQH